MWIRINWWCTWHDNQTVAWKKWHRLRCFLRSSCFWNMVPHWISQMWGPWRTLHCTWQLASELLLGKVYRYKLYAKGIRICDCCFTRPSLITMSLQFFFSRRLIYLTLWATHWISSLALSLLLASQGSFVEQFACPWCRCSRFGRRRLHGGTGGATG